MPSSLLLPLVCDIEFTPPRLAARRPPRHDRRVLELTALVVRDRVHIRLASALSAVAASTARASGQCADVDCDGAAGAKMLLSSATTGAHACDEVAPFSRDAAASFGRIFLARRHERQR